MKLFCALTRLPPPLPSPRVNPQLHQVKRVYILAMGSGMDQFLANQLTKAGVFEVVTDPKKADAIVTDSVGEAVQKKLDDLYPPPPKPKALRSNQAGRGLKPDARRRRQHCRESLNRKDCSTEWIFRRRPRGQHLRPRQGQYLRRGPGSRIVLWSVYERPKNSTPRRTHQNRRQSSEASQRRSDRKEASRVAHAPCVASRLMLDVARFSRTTSR